MIGAIQTDGLGTAIGGILIAVYIAWERFTSWKAARKSDKIEKVTMETHALVNGRGPADAAAILALSRRIYEYSSKPEDKAAMDIAQKVFDERSSIRPQIPPIE